MISPPDGVTGEVGYVNTLALVVVAELMSVVFIELGFRLDRERTAQPGPS